VNEKNNATKSWEAAQQEILQCLVDLLHRIEWHYGDNRAPVRYPPVFSMAEKPDGTQSFHCTIETDFGEPEEQLVFSAGSPQELAEEVCREIRARFGPPVA